MATAVLLQIQ